MKRFVSLMIAVLIAASFASCQKQDVEIIEDGNVVSGLVFSSEKPAFDDMTKTEWTGETIRWSAGDYIRVAYTCNDIWQNKDGSATDDEAEGSKTAKIYSSDKLAEAVESAQFSVPGNFTNDDEGEYVFYGVYPSAAVSSADMKYAPSVTVEVPSEQTPLADSFDALADLMVSKSGVYSGIPDYPVSLAWERQVAHGYFTLKGLPVAGMESISTITLTADAQADMVGTHYLYLNTYNVVKPNSNVSPNVLTVNGKNLTIDASGNVTFWTCFLPCTWTSITVQVETDKATYTREIDLTGNVKTFVKNARNILAINMENALREQKIIEDYSGTYAIVAYRTSEQKYYYLTNEETNTNPVRLVAKSAGTERPENGVILNASKLWCLDKSDNTYTIKSEDSGQFVSWSSGNSASMEDNGINFTITREDDGTFLFVSSGRNLSLNNNTGNDYFAMYAGTQINNLYLIEAVEGEEPKPTLSKIEVTGQTTTFTVGETFEFDGTVTATYSDGSTTTVEPTSVSVPDMSAVGTVDVTVTYTEDEVTKTVLYQITIAEELSPGQSVTVELSSFTSTSADIDQVVSYTTAKGGGTANPAVNSNQIRLYQKSSEDTKGGSITISADDGYVLNSVTIGSGMTTSVVYTIDSTESELKEIEKNGKLTVEDINADSITFHCMGTTSSARLYVNYLSVTYKAAAE